MKQRILNAYNAHNDRDPIAKFFIEIVLGAIGMFLFMIGLASIVAFIQWDASVYYEDGVGSAYRLALAGGALVAFVRGLSVHIIPIIDPNFMKEDNS